MIERITRFQDSRLVGIFHVPDALVAEDLPGIVMLSPGLVHRVGPNRLYVKIARALAADGYPVLRFDFSGIGDSAPRTDSLPIEKSTLAEAEAAIDHLIEQTGRTRVVLIGHCSGALISWATAFNDERVAGVVAISPEGGDEAWVEFDRKQKEARYYANYYTRGALNDSGRWRRFLTGKADYASIARNLYRGVIFNRMSAFKYKRRSVRGTAAKEAEERPEVRAYKQGLLSLAERRLPILLIHPDQSAGPEMLRALLGTTIDTMHAAGHLEISHIPASDHMFTPLAAQQNLVTIVREWMPSISVARPAALTAVRDAP
jgi:pimeloyl-ACP methyl ester carboxylesterase